MSTITIKDELINFEELTEIFPHTGCSYLQTCSDLFEDYRYRYSRQLRDTNIDTYFKHVRLLSFFFLAGRIQGIREERQRQKNSQN
jgi:hypothetical protein